MEEYTVVITGGGRGIGAETAERFAERGADVVVADLDYDVAEETVEALDPYPGDGYALEMDVTDTQSVEDGFAEVVDEYGSVDVLVNSAGVLDDGFLTGMDDAQWERVLDVNLGGTFKCGREAARYMQDQEDGGVILNASSVVAREGNPGQTNYVASKGGVEAMTKGWANELAPDIRVNAVAPGFTDTRMIEDVPDPLMEQFEDETPLGRTADTGEIADAYVFLASEEASYITGEVLHVDGGLTL